ncbi:MAG: hypothetical protein ACO1QR_07455, partial [Chthoniobacteraceae bacterium]
MPSTVCTRNHRNPIALSTLVLLGMSLLVSATTLAGWLAGVEALRRFMALGVAMNPVTAVSIILLAVAVLLARKRVKSTEWKALILAIAGAVTIAPTERLGEILLGVDLVTDAVQLSKMPPTTASNLLLLALALALTLFRKTRQVARVLCALALLSATFAFVGYALNSHLSTWIGRYFPMSLPTAICSSGLAFAILLLRPTPTIRRVFARNLPGAVTLRLLLPCAV